MNSNEDMQKMQQDAIKRVREMQARATMSMNGANHKNQQIEFEHMNTPQNSKITTQTSSYHASQQADSNHSKGFFKAFDAFIKDEERALILILLILLANDEENIGIVLVLIYLLI